MHCFVFPLLAVLLACIAGLATAEYYKVFDQTNSALKSSEALFNDLLFPSAVFKSDASNLDCLPASDYSKYMLTVPSWTLNSTIPSIYRSFAFDDFKNAFLFMTAGAQLAEKNQHHPDWRNLYNTVEVTMTTDDKECLSTFDFEFAQGLDIVFSSSEN